MVFTVTVIRVNPRVRERILGIHVNHQQVDQKICFYETFDGLKDESDLTHFLIIKRQLCQSHALVKLQVVLILKPTKFKFDFLIKNKHAKTSLMAIFINHI